MNPFRIGPARVRLIAFVSVGVAMALASGIEAQPQPGDARKIEPRWVHLRSGEAREWSSFPEAAEGKRLEARFSAEKNESEYTLRLRQQDVKQAWKVSLNSKAVGELVRDENDMVVYLPVAAGLLREGENVLAVERPAGAAAASDDIRIGEIWLEPRTRMEALAGGTLEVTLIDADSQMPLPGRITIVTPDGSLQTTANISNDHLAVRPGVVYTSDGRARIGLPAGKYTLYGGRGFEYSLAKSEVSLLPGEPAQRTLAFRREVPTPGYVACDTHIHTLTYSGHGDASISERMITLAGEGIELPIATDHNLHIDYQTHAERLGVRPYFTPVIGNEVTTGVGHFNVFPVTAGIRVADFKQKEWGKIFDEIFGTPGVKVAILNHARDLHGNTRPFGPQLFNDAIGENLDGWPMRFNGMEVVNSGATQTDPLRLVHDWMALLNRGYAVTPVGSSDSHDVARYIVGQGRTYIRCDDQDASQIDVAKAVDSFLAGRVLVSYGLLAEIAVDWQFESGNLVTNLGEEMAVLVQVKGPAWTQADRIRLFANGQLVREQKTLALSLGPSERMAGVKGSCLWQMPRPKHDVHLVAVATGPGIDDPYWPTAKPYQPTSPEWKPYVLGVSGAVWVDGDLDGKQSSAREYAEWAFAAAGGDLAKLMAALATFDAAVAAQAAHLVQLSGQSLDAEEVRNVLKSSAPQVQKGFSDYQEAWRENERARAQR